MNNAPDHLASVVRDIISIDGPDDGVIFDPDSVEAHRIKEGADYEGVRTRFIGYLGNARITMQVDTGYGRRMESTRTVEYEIESYARA
jgi:hypothetical protein